MPLSLHDLVPLSSSLPADHRRITIPCGVAGTAATIEQMRNLVTQGKRDFRIRSLAGDIISGRKGIPAPADKNYYGYAKAIFLYCQNKIRYAFDPVGVELLESPWKIVQAGIADCDSICILMASLMESLGLRCEFVTIKADSSKPDEFSHVYLQVFIPNHGPVAADATMKQVSFGWRPGAEFPMQTWPASKDSPESHDGDAMIKGLEGFFGDMPCMAMGSCPCPDKRRRGPRFKRQLPSASPHLSGLGASSKGVAQILMEVSDGTYKLELDTQEKKLTRQTETLNDLSASIREMPPGAEQNDALANLAKARNSVGDAWDKHNQAKSNYRAIVDELGRWGINTTGLSGMGVLPAAVIPAIVVAGAITAAALALSALVYQVGSAINNNEGIISQVSRAIQSTGTTISSGATFIETATSSTLKIGTFALIGVGAYLLFKTLKKKGKI